MGDDAVDGALMIEELAVGPEEGLNLFSGDDRTCTFEEDGEHTRSLFGHAKFHSPAHEIAGG